MLAAGSAGLLWVGSLFQEPQARLVPSLAAELGARSILAVFAHPDDEIKAATVLAEAARRPGVVVRMITATRGENGIRRPGLPPEELAAIRRAEVLDDGAALGLREQEVWEYPDGGLAAVPEQELVGRLRERLLRWQPDLVLTFEPASGYTGHPDHERIGQATAAACRALAAASVPGGTSYAPRWLVYVLAPRPVARWFGGARGRRVAARQPAPSLAVRVDRGVEVRAWRIHRSQSDYVRRFAHVPPALVYLLYDKEYYTAVALGR